MHENRIYAHRVIIFESVREKDKMVFWKNDTPETFGPEIREYTKTEIEFTLNRRR